jgi:hypothetical protein
MGAVIVVADVALMIGLAAPLGRQLAQAGRDGQLS